MELLNNAARGAKEGSHTWRSVAARRARAPRLHVRLHKKEGMCTKRRVLRLQNLEKRCRGHDRAEEGKEFASSAAVRETRGVSKRFTATGCKNHKEHEQSGFFPVSHFFVNHRVKTLRFNERAREERSERTNE